MVEDFPGDQISSSYDYSTNPGHGEFETIAVRGIGFAPKKQRAHVKKTESEKVEPQQSRSEEE